MYHQAPLGQEPYVPGIPVILGPKFDYQSTQTRALCTMWKRVLLAPTGALIAAMCYYAIDVASVTLSRLHSINAIDVTRC